MIKKATQYKQPSSLLLLGTPGTGKSTFVSQFPGIFILDCDNNLAGPIRWLKDNNKEVDFYCASPCIDDDGTEVPREHWYRRAAQLLVQASEMPEIKTICIDSLSSFSDMVMVEVLRQQGRKLGSFDKLTDTNKVKAADEQLQIQDWGVFFNMIKQVFFRLKSCGKMLVVTGHIKTSEDSLTKSINELVAIPGQSANQISGWFSEVWKLENSIKRRGSSSEQERLVQTFPSGKLQEYLGLKSSAGVATGTAMNADALIKQICQTK